MRQSFTEADVGRTVLAKKYANSTPVRAVVIEVSPPLGLSTRIPRIARLRKDGTIREEAIWTGLWFDVLAVSSSDVTVALPLEVLQETLIALRDREHQLQLQLQHEVSAESSTTVRVTGLHQLDRVCQSIQTLLSALS